MKKLTEKQIEYLRDLLDFSGQTNAVIGDVNGEGIDLEYAKTHYECCIALGHNVKESKEELRDIMMQINGSLTPEQIEKLKELGFKFEDYGKIWAKDYTRHQTDTITKTIKGCAFVSKNVLCKVHCENIPEAQHDIEELKKAGIKC